MNEAKSALDNLIKFWESELQYEKWLMEPSTITQIELTLAALKKLRDAI